MARRTGASGGIRGNKRKADESTLTQVVNAVFDFVRFAEFEILYVLFFVVAFIIFKDLTSRPEFNHILVKKSGGASLWPY